ncbi:hypothetical protein SLEP1_g47913 [Rubroshorea leprosula]|uniref:Uncharacterized protein n=1 Tax=Rubroshorea leprosula TaxID=152421 RepID=A0AAV5LSY5_9ROSI|nr:hypothetical protein SLEP1_g47913 [Rubroshorea leprosula]
MALPIDAASIYAGLTPPNEIVVVVHLASFATSSASNCEKRLVVVGSPRVGKWKLLDDESSPHRISVGLSSQPFSVACYDIFYDRIPFSSILDLIKICTMEVLLIDVPKMKVELSPDKMILKIKDVMIISDQLDLVKQAYIYVQKMSQHLFPFHVKLCLEISVELRPIYQNLTISCYLVPQLSSLN